MTVVTWQASFDLNGRAPKGALVFQPAGSNLSDRVPLVNGQLSTTLTAGAVYTVTEEILGRPAQTYSVQVPASGGTLNLSDYHVEPGQPVLQTITREEFDALEAQVGLIDSGASSYREQTFATPAATWPVTHDLGRTPIVSVLDSSGTVMLADVDYPSVSQVTVTFATPTSGKVILI